MQNRQNNHGTSFGRYHHKQREKIIKILSSKSFDINKCIERCKCKDDFYNKAIYGVSFPCCHKILQIIYSNTAINNFKQINSVNVERFLIYFLNMPINYGRYYSENELKEKASEIINYYSINEQIKLDQKTTFSLMKHLFGALSYKLPDPLQFPENYNDNVN